MNSELSKPERVRERVAGVCSYHHYCCQLWAARMDGGAILSMNAELGAAIANHQDKTHQRIDDIMFGHPCGISIA